MQARHTQFVINDIELVNGKYNGYFDVIYNEADIKYADATIVLIVVAAPFIFYSQRGKSV